MGAFLVLANLRSGGVVLVRFFFYKSRTQCQVDVFLQRRSLIIGDIYRASQLNKLRGRNPARPLRPEYRPR